MSLNKCKNFERPNKANIKLTKTVFDTEPAFLFQNFQIHFFHFFLGFLNSKEPCSLESIWWSFWCKFTNSLVLIRSLIFLSDFSDTQHNRNTYNFSKEMKETRPTKTNWASLEYIKCYFLTAQVIKYVQLYTKKIPINSWFGIFFTFFSVNLR